MAKLFKINNNSSRPIFYTKYILGCLGIVLLGMASAGAESRQSAKLKYSYQQNRYLVGSLQNTLGYKQSALNALSFRYMLEYRQGRHILATHLALDYSAGTQLALQQRLNAYMPVNNTEAEKPWQLQQRSSSHEQSSSALVDRLYYGYYGDSTIIKLGRQALSLGNGLVFQPLDMISPFSFTRIDQEYKEGTEMLYAQYLDEQGNDYALIIVPRKNTLSQKIEAQNSSFLLSSHVYYGNTPINLLLGQDRNNNLLAVGSSMDTGQWTLQAEFLLRDYDTLGIKTSCLINGQSSWQWHNHNITLGLEYFYSGIGQKSLSALDQIPADLQKQLGNAQLFTLMQNYFALQATISLNALNSLAPLLIQNLDDGSLLAIISYQKSLSDNSLALLSLLFSPSDPDTEFGGISLSSKQNLPLSNTNTLLFEWRQYF